VGCVAGGLVDLDDVGAIDGALDRLSGACRFRF
jgi:hypothetical protein